jgi:hypothetical protein
MQVLIRRHYLPWTRACLRNRTQHAGWASVAMGEKLAREDEKNHTWLATPPDSDRGMRYSRRRRLNQGRNSG